MEILTDQTLKNPERFLILILIAMLIGAFLSASSTALYNPDGERELLILGGWTEKQLNQLISESSKIQDASERIEFISEQFLGVKYKEGTLIGDANTNEVFIINLEGMDCFTYIDYVEAMRLSNSFSEFKDNLRQIRYRSGSVSFRDRNHFFSDWAVYNGEHIHDVTEEIGGRETKSVEKNLNKKEDGSYFLPGLPPKERQIKYISSRAIDEAIIGQLRSGDYIGVYSDMQGLDVSHTGIVIKNRDKAYLRHASSRKENGKVMEEDLWSYISDKPGLVVLRPK